MKTYSVILDKILKKFWNDAKILEWFLKNFVIILEKIKEAWVIFERTSKRNLREKKCSGNI